MTQSIDKEQHKPAYAQLASILRGQIAEGLYQPGEKIPSESAISKHYGISPMTVRQAVNLLSEQGLLRRIQGSGTFVKALELTGSRFGLDSLKEIFQNPKGAKVQVIQLSLSPVDNKTERILSLPEGGRAILLRRLLLRDERPLLLHEGHIRCEPTSPVVEAELELGPMSDLFSPLGRSVVKKGELDLVPAVLNREEADLLQRSAEDPVFRIEYVFYDFSDSAINCGWFVIPPDVLRMNTRLGLW